MSNFLSLDEHQTKALLDGIHKLSELFWGPDPQKFGAILTGEYWLPFKDLESVLKYDPPEVLQKMKDQVLLFRSE